ncbi:hypothetical protein [Streptomyces canus]|nr:hypothetical protein [Streptomyces canus]MCX4852638.1 hypothetical protein [Streptomyces canus]
MIRHQCRRSRAELWAKAAALCDAALAEADPLEGNGWIYGYDPEEALT